MNLSTLRQAVDSKVGPLQGSRNQPTALTIWKNTEHNVAHLGFTVGMSSSTAMPERQRRSGGYIEYPSQVTFAYRLRPLDVYPTDYDNTLDVEQCHQEGPGSLCHRQPVYHQIYIIHQGSDRQPGILYNHTRLSSPTHNLTRKENMAYSVSPKLNVMEKSNLLMELGPQ
jgi:hypothetical protein